MRNVLLISLVVLLAVVSTFSLDIVIDAQKDDFYGTLTGPADGAPHLSYADADVPNEDTQHDQQAGHQEPEGHRAVAVELEHALVAAVDVVGVHGVHHLVALTPLRDQLRDDLGRILKVGVDDDNGSTLRSVHSRRHRRLLYAGHTARQSKILEQVCSLRVARLRRR